jgi:CBS domain containing-hemolysin-like protein
VGTEEKNGQNEKAENGPIDIVLGLLAVVVLILAHGIFVAGEFGLVAVDRSAIEVEAERGSRRARTALSAVRNLSFELSGAQLGITATSLVVGFLVEPAIAPAIRPLVVGFGLPDRTALGVSITLALVLATAAEMVVAELIPQYTAIARPQQTALTVAPVLRIFNTLFKPVIVVLNSAANWTVRLLGIEPKDELIPMRSLQELELLIHASRKGGALQQEEYSLLARSLTFANKTAADALVPRTAIVALRQDANIGELTRLALESGLSRLPVFEEDLDNIVGIANVKDTYRYPIEQRPSQPVRTILREPRFVPESRDLESLLIEMRRDRQHLIVVVDEYGGTEGIIALEDLLEEIVGDIEDEYDPLEQTGPVSAIPSGVHILSGLLHPDEVREVCGLDIPEGEYETLAGWLLSLFDRIPNVGDQVSFEGWEFKVIELERRRIASVLAVAPLSIQDPDDRP